MGRSPCCVKEGLNRGAWTSLEDKILTEYIKVHGEGKWRSLPKGAGLKRCGKSCRLRWLNYLRPDIKRGNITDDEEDLIIRLHKLLGNRWSLIAGRLPGRTDNEIKNYWNTNIGKRVQGHSSSSTIGKPSTRHRPNKNLSTKPQVLGQPLSQKEGSYVVRTKASRCTKVFINAEVENSQQLGIKAMKDLSITTEDDFKKTSGEVEPPAPVCGASPTFSRENNFETDKFLSDFIMDFEMDDKFLSEFLQTEFVTPYDFDMGVADNLNPKAIDTDDSSPRDCCQSPLFSAKEAEKVSELGSMASLLDPALDWLQDE